MPIKTLRHTFKKFISVGRAKELLNFHIQEMLKDIQENIGYEFIKFHGILSDDMMVVSRSQDGKLHFHYTLVDMAMDFILSIGLKPMIQLSFMPSELASDPDKQIFYIPFNTSPPQNLELKAINNGSYEMREYFVNRENGSAFDLWVKSGAMDMDAKDTELFKGMCVPGYHKELRLVEKNKLHYAPILEPLEIRFAEIRFIE